MSESGKPEWASGGKATIQTTPSSHEQRVSLALAAGNTGVWSWEPINRDLTFDRRIAAIWGVQEGAKVNVETFLGSVHQDDREGLRRSFAATLSRTGPELDEEIEARITRLDDGRERWIAVRGQTFFDTAGKLVEMIGTVRDISDQKLHDIHLHMLLREITHRSKNLLAIIQAMARQTVKDSSTAEDFEKRLSLRLSGLAASHELLAAQDWHGAHLEELVKGQLGHLLDHYAARLAFKGPSLFVKPEAAQNIGLALNELATNAVRFGALSNTQGRVEVSWHVDPQDRPDRRLHLTWKEVEGPTVAPPRRQGFGHRVVERVAARALDGIVSLTFAPSGLQWTLNIPVSFVLSGQPSSLVGIPRFF